MFFIYDSEYIDIIKQTSTATSRDRSHKPHRTAHTVTYIGAHPHPHRVRFAAAQPHTRSS